MAEMNPIKMYKGRLGPSLEDTIYIDDSPFNLTGYTVTFSMRLLDSGAVLVTGSATIVDATTGQVRYDWVAGNTDVAGRYVFWWTLTTGGVSSDTPEQRLDIDDHAPGEEARVGAIAQRVSDYLPGTMRAMRSSQQYGDEALQRTIEIVKFGLFATNVAPAAEATVYSQTVIDYVGLRAAIWSIPHAVDFYNDKSQTITTTGTNETLSFPDRAKALWEMYARLKEIAQGKVLVEEDGEWVVVSASSFAKMPAITHLSKDKVTLDPALFPGWTNTDVYGPTNLPWSTWG
jgi:hypothetical protein